MGVNVRNLANGSLKIKDGTTPTPLEITVPVMVGNLSWTEQDEAPIVRNRATMVGFADPIEQPVPITFTLGYEEYTGKTTSGGRPSPPDALRNQGVAVTETWVSTRDCGPYVTNLEFTIAKPSNCTDPLEQNEVLTFSDFRCDSLNPVEAEDMSTIEVAGRALVTTPTIVRA